MTKSSRHSKITGDFAEAFVLYWLSKFGYECARIDHTGIDLIANAPDGSERLGISVKCRSRCDGTETNSVNLPPDGFEKAVRACKEFGCTPYYAVLVDGAERIRCFLIPLDHLLSLSGNSADKIHYWSMTATAIESYNRDPLIKQFELQTVACSWRDAADSTGGIAPA